MKTHLKCLSLVLIALLFLLLCMFLLGSTFKYLLISFALTFFLFPLISKFSPNGENRKRVTAIVLSVFFLVVFLIVFFITPLLFEEIQEVLANIPRISKNLYSRLINYSATVGYDLTKTFAIFESREAFLEFVQSHSEKLTDYAIIPLVKLSQKSVFSIIEVLIGVFLVPIFFFFLVSTYESMGTFLFNVFPKQERALILKYRDRANDVLSGYFRGQVMLSFFIFAYLSIGLSLIGVKFSLLIAMVTGFLNIIPYVGITISLSLTLLSTFIFSTEIINDVVFIVLLYGAEGAVEAPYIYPKLVGSKLGLKPLETMLSLAAGLNTLGIVGALVAVPSYAVIKFIILDFIQVYQNSSFYNVDG